MAQTKKSNSTTAEFLKLRSDKEPRVGEWNSNYQTALAKAKKEGRFILAVWSNGDNCAYCVAAEKCMMTDVFVDWMKKQNVYFVFQCSADKDRGKATYDLIYGKGSKVKLYPGFKATLYSADGKAAVDYSTDGNTLRSKKAGANGAKEMIKNLETAFSKKGKDKGEDKDVTSAKVDYKIRLNEKLTTAKVNKILDAIDKNDGYCPCQPKSAGSKCHCEDFLNNKKIGEPCICNIYVKQKR